jgi:GntR family transcriptional regulator
VSSSALRQDAPLRGVQVSPDSHVPLYIQIEQDLRHLIDSGELAPLDRVPSEAELSKRFGVSRMTSRKGLDRLVAEGVLFRQPGKGTFVSAAKIDHDPASQYSFSMAMSALGLTVRTKVLVAGMVNGAEHVTGALGLPTRARVIFVRRLRLVDGSPSAIHDVYLPTRLQDILAENLESSLTELLARRDGVGAVGRDSIDALAAAGEFARLLAIPVGAPLLRKQGTVFSQSFEPLRYSEAYYRADRFKFVTESAEPHLEARVIPKE